MLPGFHLWKNPKPEVLLKVYVFNITNSEDFIAGRDKKLKIQEVGPVIFQEFLEHKDIEYHDENSTMSYTVTRRIVFKESANVKGILNQTVNVVNMALSAASFISDNFFMRQSYKFFLNTLKTQPVLSTTIYNYFFNMTDPILYVAIILIKFCIFIRAVSEFLLFLRLLFFQTISKYVCAIYCSNKGHWDTT